MPVYAPVAWACVHSRAEDKIQKIRQEVSAGGGGNMGSSRHTNVYYGVSGKGRTRVWQQNLGDKNCLQTEYANMEGKEKKSLR